ncbi:MAG: hypothetical protein WCD81_01455 [Candidatus Bathyarchaeia archaeon]
MKTRLKTIERLTCLILILTSGLITLSLLPKAVAGMSIMGLNPDTGNVGTLVTVTANVTTANGKYDVYFDQDLTASGTSSANSVNATFIVPQTTAGNNHNVTVVDVATHDNATATFNVTTSYSLVIPTMAEPLQENDSIPISVNVTGGASGMTYVANITVQAPTNVSYVNMLNVGPTSTLGNGTATANYPNDFSAGANTHFVGNYTALLNTTMSYQTFYVGLTNATQYHRNQTVNIKAVYEPNENVTITIAGNNIYNLTDPSGLINYNWTVPADTSVGNYTVSVFSSSGPTVKNPPDIQTFAVPGFAVNVTARNLAEEPVSGVTVVAFENGTVADAETTDTTGLAALNLEVGSYTCNATTQNEIVGERGIEVNDTASLDLVCNLTNLKVQVSSANTSIPDAGIYLTPLNETFTTDLNGTAIIHSLLPDLEYGLNVTRYGTSFNVTSNFQLLMNETAVAWYNVTVSCPTLVLRVIATESRGQPFNNTLVRVQEMSGEPLYEQYTDENGSATFNPPLGIYSVMVYDKSGIMLNETTVDLFQNQSAMVQCDLYDLTVSVKVVDYFGQGIGNVNVKLQREGEPTMSAPPTKADGIATFNNVIGGNLEVVLFLGDSTQPIVTQGLTVENSTTIQVTISKYIVLGGLLVETSEFATILVIALAIVFVLALEVYRFRRSKTKKSETESSNKES